MKEMIQKALRCASMGAFCVGVISFAVCGVWVIGLFIFPNNNDISIAFLSFVKSLIVIIVSASYLYYYANYLEPKQ